MSVLCSARGSKIVRSKAAPEGTRKALRGVRRARCAATEPALPARSAEGSLRRGLHAAVLAQMSARSSWSFDVAGDLELPLSSQRGVCGARRRARIGALCRRWRGRGAARVRLRCALPHTGVDFEQDCGKRLQMWWRPTLAGYSPWRRCHRRHRRHLLRRDAGRHTAGTLRLCLWCNRGHQPPICALCPLRPAHACHIRGA